MAGAAAGEQRQYVWDLSPLIADHQAWQAERDWVLARCKTIGQLDGGVDDAAHLADVLDAAYELRARATRLAIYGFLVSDVDTTSERGRLYYDAGTALEHQALAAAVFTRQRILAVGRARLDDWLEQEPRLQRHRRWIGDIVRLAPYTLGAEAEGVVDSAARWPRLAADLFAPLHGADLGWNRVRLSGGEEVTANRAGYLTTRGSPVRSDRLSIAASFFAKLAGFDELFGLLYTRRIEADLTLARQRRFGDGIEALWLQRDGMPASSYRVMIEVARDHLATLHRYVGLRARVLGLARMAPVDLYAPVPGLPGDISIPAAIDRARDALAPLGSEFRATLESLIEQPWMHLEPTPNKAWSYAIWPSVAGSPPYLFLSYDGSLDHARRVAGGLTLQAAFASIPPDRTPSTRDDPGIYANGLIYVGDLLHDALAIARARDTDERIAILVHSLDLLYQRFFRWIVVTELEVEVQQRVLAGEPPGGAEISALYLERMRAYLAGPDGVMELGPRDGAEWMNFSVPFLSYEHQFWPAAMAMAAAIVSSIEAGETEVGERCWRLLGRGEVDRTYSLLRSIGIDMASRQPYEQVIRRMDSLLDALDEAVNARDREG